MVRIDKPCVNITHALNYFKMHMAGDDYLTEQGQAEMVWFGNDASRLGLYGTVKAEDFRMLWEGNPSGYFPDGPKLLCLFWRGLASSDFAQARISNRNGANATSALIATQKHGR